MTMSQLAAAELKAGGKLQMWAIRGNNELFSAWKESDNPNAGWTHLSPFTPNPGPVNDIAAGHLSDGRVQLFATHPNGAIVSSWKESTNENSSWTPWSPFNP
jgi:hypothetical protein